MVRTINLTITLRGILLVLGALAVLWVLSTFSNLLFILFLASLLAVAITPLINRMEARRVPRALGIVIVYVGLLAVLSLAVGLLVPVMVAEVRQLITDLPQMTQRMLDFPRTWLAPRFPALGTALSDDSLRQNLNDQIQPIVGGLRDLLVSLGRTLTTLLISTFLVLVIGFFLSVDARFAPRFISRFFPPAQRPTAIALARETGTRLSHWVRAQLLVGLFFGISFGLGLALLGVPYAFSLGVAGAILELIPYVGGAIVTVIAMLIALPISPLLALGVLGLELLIANIESHIVYPKLVGDIVGLHPLAIIIALFIGAETKGVLGALLAVPTAIVIQVLFEQFYRFEEAETQLQQEATEASILNP